MASLADQYTFAQSAPFQNQVKQAMISAAIAISGEAQALNRNRTALAIDVLQRPNVWLAQFAQAVANDTTVSASIASGGASATATDVQIQNAVNASWNAFANR